MKTIVRLLSGKEIRDIRRTLCETQEAFAARFGLQRNTIATWECGVRSPRRKHLTLLNRLLNRGSVMARGKGT